MKICEIITKYNDELLSMCNCDKVVVDSRTECDMLQNIYITALKKFKENDIDEEEGYNYLRKSLLNEKHFQKKRVNTEMISFLENLEDLGV